ncbi:UDP-N-acetylglucosamine--LPS N-acetylglucosamine transferase [Patescibacteria group bacterium]|nr:UDP-N-acetylglucosamine--LPS N-acetylglucosamine transferase [Patescibacteria group bacterium]
MNKPKICLVTSPGGHLYKTFLLKPWWSKYKRFWVTSKNEKHFNFLKNEKIYYGYFPENRNIVNFLKNLILALKILKKEKPNIIFSTGAGIAPPFFLIAKIFGIKSIFLETFILSNQTTLSGKIIHFFSDLFLVQNRNLLKKYPKAKFAGSIL